MQANEDYKKLEEEDIFYDARDTLLPEDIQVANTEQEGEDWLPEDIKMEIQKLEDLEELLQDLIKPEEKDQ